MNAGAMSAGLSFLRRGLAAILRAPQQVLIGLVRGYRYLLKPWLGNACRFEPSCSAYTLQALQEQGALRGSALGGWRLLRCHPWCAGGHDPVPARFPNPAAGLFTRLGLTSADPHPPTQSPP
jgi:putative membrane protein insertion efficiency factor